jgi:hypothetical protein
MYRKKTPPELYMYICIQIMVILIIINTVKPVLNGNIFMSHDALKRTDCPLRKYTALCERNSSSMLPDVMKSLSKHMCTCINMIHA